MNKSILKTKGELQKITNKITELKDKYSNEKYGYRSGSSIPKDLSNSFVYRDSFHKTFYTHGLQEQPDLFISKKIGASLKQGEMLLGSKGAYMDEKYKEFGGYNYQRNLKKSYNEVKKNRSIFFEDRLQNSYKQRLNRSEILSNHVMEVNQQDQNAKLSPDHLQNNEAKIRDNMNQKLKVQMFEYIDSAIKLSLNSLQQKFDKTEQQLQQIKEDNKNSLACLEQKITKNHQQVSSSLQSEITRLSVKLEKTQSQLVEIGATNHEFSSKLGQLSADSQKIHISNQQQTDGMLLNHKENLSMEQLNQKLVDLDRKFNEQRSQLSTIIKALEIDCSQLSDQKQQIILGNLHFRKIVDRLEVNINCKINQRMEVFEKQVIEHINALLESHPHNNQKSATLSVHHHAKYDIFPGGSTITKYIDESEDNLDNHSSSQSNTHTENLEEQRDEVRQVRIKQIHKNQSSPQNLNDQSHFKNEIYHQINRLSALIQETVDQFEGKLEKLDINYSYLYGRMSTLEYDNANFKDKLNFFMKKSRKKQIAGSPLASSKYRDNDSYQKSPSRIHTENDIEYKAEKMHESMKESLLIAESHTSSNFKSKNESLLLQQLNKYSTSKGITISEI